MKTVSRTKRLRAALALIFLSVAAVGHAAGAREFVEVAAVIKAVSTCSISTRDAELDFGLLDPGSPKDVSADAFMTLACDGNDGEVYFTIDQDGGLYGASAGRMRHKSVSTEYLPYRLDLSPRTVAASKGTAQTLRISGVLSGEDYRLVYAGDYEDTVRVTITP